MKSLEYYEALPDSMTQEQLYDEFVEVLGADPKSQAGTIPGALFALSERQWSTYELADEDLRKDIAELVLKLWDENDNHCAHALLGVTARLGLGVVLKRLREKDWSRYSAGVRRAVEEAITEFGDTVDDPYSGMKKN